MIYFLLFLSLFDLILCGGESAIIIYSRDNTCKGQEMVRAYTSQCKPFYSNDDASLDYFTFHCNKNTNTLSIASYSDSNCMKSMSNETILLQQFQGTVTGSCQQLNQNNGNYQSAQLFCGGISAIDNPKTFFSTFETEKIMFKHYTNSDDSCANNPSVIEMFAQHTCLYFPAMESSINTGVYAMFSKEVSEGIKNEQPRISAQFFNNNQCRRGGAVVGPPNGEIGHPIRHLRSLQMIGPGEGMGMPGDHEGGPEQGGPEEGGPEGEHHEGEMGPGQEPQPGHWLPSNGEQSEIMDMDSLSNICTSSTVSLLANSISASAIDISVASFSLISFGSYFDFISHDFDSSFTSSSSSSVSDPSSHSFSSIISTLSTLVLWAFGGVAFGLVLFFLFALVTGMDLYPKPSRANQFIYEAENDILTNSKHSDHGLLASSSHQEL